MFSCSTLKRSRTPKSSKTYIHSTEILWYNQPNRSHTHTSKMLSHTAEMLHRAYHCDAVSPTAEIRIEVVCVRTQQWLCNISVGCECFSRVCGRGLVFAWEPFSRVRDSVFSWEIFQYSVRQHFSFVSERVSVSVSDSVVCQSTLRACVREWISVWVRGFYMSQ